MRTMRASAHEDLLKERAKYEARERGDDGRIKATEASGFDFVSDQPVTSVQLRLVTSRQGRIQDQLIQLADSDLNPLSSDQSRLSAGDTAVYEFSLYQPTVCNSSLGVVLDFQPHTEYPSSNTVYIRSVQLRFSTD